jgi:transcriptional regulator GlxA family with amidase domain
MPPSSTTPRVVFFAPPHLTALDLIGPMEAFLAAERVGGHRYQIEVCALTKSLAIAGNLRFSNLKPYARIKLGPNDILCVAGFRGGIADALALARKRPSLLRWIRRAWEAGATICSICTGAFFLAEAGLLDGKACATHWRDVDDLQRRYPQIEVRRASVFVEADRIFTSAGIAAGIDLAIHLLSLRHGPKLAFEVAHQMVVYLRRSGDFEQESIYLKYRNHLDETVHRAQSLLIERLDRPLNLDQLAAQVGASSRNLTRRFRRSIGLSIGEYHRELRLERARTLLLEKGSKVDDVARACGFTGPRQLRNLYHGRFGRSPREGDRRLAASA